MKKSTLWIPFITVFSDTMKHDFAECKDILFTVALIRRFPKSYLVLKQDVYLVLLYSSYQLLCLKQVFWYIGIKEGQPTKFTDIDLQ